MSRIIEENNREFKKKYAQGTGRPYPADEVGRRRGIGHAAGDAGGAYAGDTANKNRDGQG
ncbi:MAG: hypothetical protein IJO02_07995 [Clostridia bacterium]|nr:hypothetical protein [Clostridia bacterium]